ncbi:hypothetical protein SAMN05216214_10953 [Atopomonas hussainii]|uniref:Uncharacterized protein n=1 Tax=Atopomonas hussainii TaxID=1429083 RepID=A0A1H7N824_9GAMM|nr:hypothetical protein [Atopomonas hussainii]SEL19663.1 hypothetical protein SAMN05216214_10953 [Atopomonas hussainii]
MRNSWRVLTLAALLVSAWAQADETTKPQEITRIQYSAANKTLYFASTTGWGAPSCPNATYAYAHEASTPGLATLTSLGMQAKASGSMVTFTGTCDNAEHMKIDYIIIN